MTMNERLRSPAGIFIIYVLACSLIIMIFRFIFPGSPEPLWIYSRDWRFLQGFLEVVDWFPALAFSGIVVPFGLVSLEEHYQSFSEVFFKRLYVSVMIAIIAAIVYALIFFLALPNLKNKEEDLRYKGETYRLARKYAQERRDSGDWYEASQFLDICDSIWLNNIELNDLKVEVEVNLARLRSDENHERALARAALLREWRGADITSLSADYEPADTVQALSMSTEAYNDQRYFDAHWLATLAGRLAAPGSPEAVSAARLASNAWNMIAIQQPNQRESRQYEIYQLKLSGYQAMDSGDWIRAFYIFSELLGITPDDPDAANFFTASERGAREYAFFIEEMELSIGEILTGAVFSLPSESGRAVVRFSHLTTSRDVSYGIEFEYMAFDENARPVTSVRSRYAKVLPFVLNGKQQVLVLTHALDRDDERNNQDSEWLIGNKTPGGIILNVSYEDLMLLSYIRYGLANLQINELFSASKDLSEYGHVTEIFQAEILNRFGTVLFFLPMAIITITLGWRYRVKTRPRYFFVIMLPALPAVFHAFVFMYRAVINTLGIYLVLSLGFTFAIAAFIITLTVFMFVSLIVLAAQHS